MSTLRDRLLGWLYCKLGIHVPDAGGLVWRAMVRCDNDANWQNVRVWMGRCKRCGAFVMREAEV